MTPASRPVVEAWGAGASFLVKAHAGAKRDGIAGVHDGMVRVEVTTAPEKGKANRAVAKLLAKGLGIAPAMLELLAGDANPRKRFGVKEMPPAELARRLERLLGA